MSTFSEQFGKSPTNQNIGLYLRNGKGGFKMPPGLDDSGLVGYKLQRDAKQKYIFVQPFSIRIPATGTGRAAEGEGDGKITVNYNVGNIVEGVLIQGNTAIDEPNYVVLDNGVRVPIGGRAIQVITPYFVENIPGKGPKEVIVDSPANQPKPTTKKLLTTKNLVIGVVVFLAFVGLVKIVK